MGIHVKNITHVDVYWKKTVWFDYESVKFTSMDMKQSAVGVYWVSDGVDRCLVQYLCHHQVKHLNNWKELSVKLHTCTLTTLTVL